MLFRKFCATGENICTLVLLDAIWYFLLLICIISDSLWQGPLSLIGCGGRQLCLWHLLLALHAWRVSPPTPRPAVPALLHPPTKLSGLDQVLISHGAGWDAWFGARNTAHRHCAVCLSGSKWIILIQSLNQQNQTNFSICRCFSYVSVQLKFYFFTCIMWLVLCMQ